VLAARLSDAKFFWEQDLKVSLDTQAQKLAQITFHEKLGSVADKVERVAKLARWLVEEGIVKSSPERGGGARAASDGGGSLPPASFDAESPLHRASTVPLPAGGEDLADQAERAAKPARWLVEEGIVGPRSPAQAGVQPATNESFDAVLDPGLRRGTQDLEGASNPNVTPAKAGGQLRSAPLESTGQEMDSRLRGNDEDISVRALADQAERAARLCKADLVTGMVGEFPELQGIMGGYYARAQGESDAVADAIRDHYKPVGQGDDVPTAPVTVAVSLADKLDTLLAFFLIDEKPTGSKDPFALRRAMLGVIRIILENGIRTQLTYLVRMAMILNIVGLAYREYVPLNEIFVQLKDENFAEAVRLTLLAHAKERKETKEAELIKGGEVTARELGTFLADRLKVQQREAGVRHDLIDAVFSLGGEDDLVRLLARVKALQAYITTAEGANLLAAYKRAANSLKQAGEFGFAHLQREKWEPAEGKLQLALNKAEPKAAAALSVEDFEGAMAALASLRAPIDAFFEGVMVNDPDPAKRKFRLGLLARFRDAVHQVADFSKIEG
jgi:glycyl-tRNA synthetase beta chain